ncbi:GMC family oxidoreductase N-terminal domain-containing protein [Lachnotalea glycerini]|uniref:GMC family oxidoreductase n=1 Tax=Lachnotalea glycerini TaxID=1763509 RepID=A0A371JKF3_9FIRM|nr:GMC family oxidoreductase N-terminal domain-containing protein [Lachnotalea glycerini]RDY33209.1 GMC family oxidoreductase [Lachnotalea glycerini]
MKSDFEVIVIGGGGGGAVVARELSEKGVSVLLLEAGPWYGNRKWPKPNDEQGAKSSSQYEDLSIDILKECFTDLEDDMNSLISGRFRWGPANRNQGPWERRVAHGGFTWQNSGIGGSTLHYLGNSPRAYPQAINRVWPITYDELIPYYEIVEKKLSVSPAPALAKEELFYYGAQRARWEPLETKDIMSPGYRAQPNAILRRSQPFEYTLENSKSYEPYGCSFRGHCVNGCHIGPAVEAVAKRSTFASYIPYALKTGNVEVKPNSFVIQILTEENENKEKQAIGVIVRNTWTGEISEYRADVIVMAAGSIETPRLWMNSNLPENEWVGRGLVNHWFDCVTGIYEEATLMENIGKPNIKPYVGQNSAVRFDYPGLGVIQTFGCTPGVFSSLLYASSDKGYYFENETNPESPWDFEGAVIGEQLKEFMMNYQKTLCVIIFTDDEVSQQNGIILDREQKDENGYIPIITYHPSEKDRIKRDKLAVIAANILREAGAKTVIRANWSPDIYIHILSTMRMGFVTNTDCETLQVKRLYIADNSVLCNSLGGPNPTLTTQALATRTSEKIFSKYFASYHNKPAQ